MKILSYQSFPISSLIELSSNVVPLANADFELALPAVCVLMVHPRRLARFVQDQAPQRLTTAHPPVPSFSMEHGFLLIIHKSICRSVAPRTAQLSNPPASRLPRIAAAAGANRITDCSHVQEKYSKKRRHTCFSSAAGRNSGWRQRKGGAPRAAASAASRRASAAGNARSASHSVRPRGLKGCSSPAAAPDAPPPTPAGEELPR